MSGRYVGKLAWHDISCHNRRVRLGIGSLFFLYQQSSTSKHEGLKEMAHIITGGQYSNLSIARTMAVKTMAMAISNVQSKVTEEGV